MLAEEVGAQDQLVMWERMERTINAHAHVKHYRLGHQWVWEWRPMLRVRVPAHGRGFMCVELTAGLLVYVQE